jgi:hypothetical protein
MIASEWQILAARDWKLTRGVRVGSEVKRMAGLESPSLIGKAGMECIGKVRTGLADCRMDWKRKHWQEWPE